MTVRLPLPGQGFDRRYEVERNRQIEMADSENHKKNRDVELGGGRLIMTDDNGVRYEVYVETNGALQVKRIDGGSMNILDAFGRMRVSEPLTLFDSQLQYTDMSLIYETVTTGSGTTSFNSNESSETLTVSAGGDSVLRQSRQYMRYKPGKSHLVMMTGSFGSTPSSDLIRRMGYYDDDNGIYLKQDSSGLHWVRRTYTSGSAVEETVAQASWSEFTFPDFDPSKTFLAFIDMEWLGVGQVRVGFFDKGVPVTAHIFNQTQALTVPYIQTANLPVRWEISSAATETGSMKQICASVISEGGIEEDLGIPQGRDNLGSGASIATGSEVPVIAIRPKASFNSKTNRGTIIPEAIDILADQDACYRIYYNASVTTGASWTSQGSNSITEYDVSATAFSTTGAELIASGFVAANGVNTTTSESSDFTVRLPIVLDKAGSNPIELVVTMQALTSSGTGYASLRWRELY